MPLVVIWANKETELRKTDKNNTETLEQTESNCWAESVVQSFNNTMVIILSFLLWKKKRKNNNHTIV